MPVHASNTYYILTAAHCFSVGSQVTNNSYSIPRGSGALIDTVSAIDGTSRGLDAELIKQSCQSCSGSHALWVGYTTNPGSTVFQSTPGGSPAGIVVCDDGAFEGQVCDTTVAAQGCYAFDVGTRCHILLATGSNPNDAGQATVAVLCFESLMGWCTLLALSPVAEGSRFSAPTGTHKLCPVCVVLTSTIPTSMLSSGTSMSV